MFDDVESPVERAARDLEAAVADLFAIHDVTLGISGEPETIRLRGELQAPSEEAFPQILARFRERGYTAVLRHDDEHDLDVLLAVPGVMPEESGSRLWLNALLFGLTILSTLFVGVLLSDQVPPEADLGWIVTHLWVGWPFALSLMTILTGHELGHYFAGRYYKMSVSLPYFIPLPLPPFGTMGAFILMKSRSINRRQMLTVGAAGPLAGFVLAVPILIVGLGLSHVIPMETPAAGQAILLEGNSLLYLLLKFAVFDQILPGSGAALGPLPALGEVVAALLGTFPLDSGYDVQIHSVAMAGWAGLLVTALNLLPVGQLDGGHVLYSLIGQRAQRLTWPVIGLLVLLGILLSPSWFLWAALIFLFGQSHPDPLDDVTRLDTARKAIALAVLVIFVLTFTPLPLQQISGELPAEAAQGLGCLGPAGLVIVVALWLRRRRRPHKELESR